MVIAPLQVELTQAETRLKEKILRLSGEEFRNELNTLSDKELEELAITFLLPESTDILLENGYNAESIIAEFNNDNLKLVHKALALYGEKINTNQ